MSYNKKRENVIDRYPRQKIFTYTYQKRQNLKIIERFVDQISFRGFLSVTSLYVDESLTGCYSDSFVYALTMPFNDKICFDDCKLISTRRFHHCSFLVCESLLLFILPQLYQHPRIMGLSLNMNHLSLQAMWLSNITK